MNHYRSQFPIENPPQDFKQWFEPYMVDPESGAHIGGHPEAKRTWARKDEGRWSHRVYGMPTRVAWADNYIREQYDAWKAVGAPQRDKDFMSVATTVEKQKEFWRNLKTKIGSIGKKMPEPEVFDYPTPETLEY